MTIPFEYQCASIEFEQFLLDARDISGLATTNMAWNMVVGVLHTFRRRLPVPDALRFANVLPPVLRAVFVADWDAGEPQRPFDDRATMTREVQALRAAHNFSPETAIRDVAQALRRHVDGAGLERVLATLPAGARDYWAV